MSEVTSTHERRKLKELDMDDLKAISVALLALVEDEEIPQEVREKENITRLFIREWLKKRKASPRLERAEFLSIPNFYLDPAQVGRIRDISDIDDFPVLEPDDLTYVDKETGLNLMRNERQTSFFALGVKAMGIQHAAHLHVQPAGSEWVYTSGEKIKLYTLAWDSKGPFSPHMLPPEAVDFIEVLKAYGEELQEEPSVT